VVFSRRSPSDRCGEQSVSLFQRVARRCRSRPGIGARPRPRPRRRPNVRPTAQTPAFVGIPPRKRPSPIDLANVLDRPAGREIPSVTDRRARNGLGPPNEPGFGFGLANGESTTCRSRSPDEKASDTRGTAPAHGRPGSTSRPSSARSRTETKASATEPPTRPRPGIGRLDDQPKQLQMSVRRPRMGRVHVTDERLCIVGWCLVATVHTRPSDCLGGARIASPRCPTAVCQRPSRGPPRHVYRVGTPDRTPSQRTRHARQA
jgi:hypothetical protein